MTQSGRRRRQFVRPRSLQIHVLQSVGWGNEARRRTVREQSVLGVGDVYRIGYLSSWVLAAEPDE
jgi:hypothetical protein